MFRNVLCLFLVLCLAVPLGSTPLVDELTEISSQFRIALQQAEKALNELESELEIAKSLQKEQGRELGLLKTEAQALRLEIESLKQALGESKTLLLAAVKQLDSVTQRLTDLRKSFDAYRLRVARLERQKKTWRTVALIEAVVIVAGAVLARTR